VKTTYILQKYHQTSGKVTQTVPTRTHVQAAPKYKTTRTKTMGNKQSTMATHLTSNGGQPLYYRAHLRRREIRPVMIANCQEIYIIPCVNVVRILLIILHSRMALRSRDNTRSTPQTFRPLTTAVAMASGHGRPSPFISVEKSTHADWSAGIT